MAQPGNFALLPTLPKAHVNRFVLIDGKPTVVVDEQVSRRIDAIAANLEASRRMLGVNILNRAIDYIHRYYGGTEAALVMGQLRNTLL